MQAFFDIGAVRLPIIGISILEDCLGEKIQLLDKEQ
jgi:hypothetical protein